LVSGPGKLTVFTPGLVLLDWLWIEEGKLSN
jgi:hypothetical protein